MIPSAPVIRSTPPCSRNWRELIASTRRRSQRSTRLRSATFSAYATAAAAITVSRSGADLPTAAEVDASA